MTIHQRIKKAREAKGWTMQELAEKVGYAGFTAISKVESGERSVNHEMLKKYADVLDVSPLWLLYGDEYEDKNELIKKLTEKNELLAGVNRVLEADIADRDKLLEQKVADVYPEFMKDYKLMQKELDFYFDKNEEESELLEKAISTYGADAQLTVAIEELSELIKELCKAKRGAVRIENVIEEMADCHIMLDQLSLIFSIDYSEITAAREQKLNRLKERLEIKKKWHHSIRQSLSEI